MARDSHMRERIFFTHSDPHGTAPQHGRFLTGMPDDDLLLWSLHEKEEVEKFLLTVVARFKAFKRRVQSKGCGAHPQRAYQRLRPRPNPLFCLSFRVWRM